MAAPTITSIGQGTNTSSTDTITLTTSTAVAAGETIVVRVLNNNKRDTISLTDSAGNSYTEATDIDGGSIWYCLDPSALSAGSTITATLNSNASGKVILADKLNTTAIFEKAKSKFGGSSSESISVTITSIPADAIVLGGALNRSNRTGTNPVGWTEDYNNTVDDSPFLGAYDDTTSSGNVTYTVTWSDSGETSAVIIAFTGTSGSTYEDTSNTAVDASITALEEVTKEESSTLATTENITASSIATLEESISFGVTKSFPTSSIGTFSDSISLGTTDTLTVSTANIAYIIPGGVGDGSSWASGANIANLNFLIDQVGPGGVVYIRANDGDIYASNSYTITNGGASGEPITISGRSSNGDFNHAIISGGRTNWTLPSNSEITTNTALWTHGGDFLELGTGANHLRFEYLDIRRVQNAFEQTSIITDIQYRNLEGYNVRRFIESSAGANVTNVVIDTVNIVGHSKHGIRIRGSSNNWLLNNVNINSGRQDYDNFAVCIAISETAHDITVNNALLENCHDTNGSYWNGDGISTEVGNYDLFFKNIETHGHTDGGIDSKGRTSYTNVHSYDNKVNLRLHANNHIANGVTSNTVNMRGGTGHPAHIGLYYNNPVNRGTTAIINNLVVNETANGNIIWHAGNNCSLTVNTYTLTYTDPPATLNKVSGGVVGNSLTWIPPLPDYPTYQDSTNGGGALDNYANAVSTSTGPVTPAEPPSSTEDDILLCVVGTTCTDSGAGSFSDSVGGWTKLDETTVVDGTFKTALFWRRRGVSAATISVSYSGTTTGTFAWIYGYRGAEPTDDPFDDQGSGVLYAKLAHDDANSIGPNIVTNGTYRTVVNLHVTQDNTNYSDGPSAGWTSRHNGASATGGQARFAIEDINVLNATTQTGSTRSTLEEGVVYGVALFSEGNAASPQIDDFSNTTVNTTIAANYDLEVDRTGTLGATGGLSLDTILNAEETVSLGTQGDLSLSSLLDTENPVNVDTQTDVSSAGNVDSEEAIGLDVSSNITSAEDVIIEKAITLDALATLITSSDLILSLVSTLTVELGMVKSNILTSENAITLQKTLEMSDTLNITIPESVLLSIVNGLSKQVDLSVDKVAELSTTLGYNVTTTLEITKAMVLSATAAATKQGTLTQDEAVSLALATGFSSTGAITVERAVSLASFVDIATAYNLTLDQSVVIATIAAHAITELVDMEDSVSLDATTTQLSSLGSIFIETISLALQQGLSEDEDFTAENAIAFSTQQDTSLAETLDAENSIGLDTTSDASVSSIATMEEDISMGTGTSTGSDAGNVQEVSSDLGASAGESASSLVNMEDNATLDAGPGVSTDSAHDLQESITLGTQVGSESSALMVMEDSITVQTSVAQGEALMAAVLEMDEASLIALQKAVTVNENIDKYTSIVLNSIMDVMMNQFVGDGAFEEVITLSTTLAQSAQSLLDISEQISLNTNIKVGSIGKSVQESVTQLIRSNPENRNFLTENKFLFTLTTLPEVSLFVVQANLPDVSLGSTELGNPVNYMNIPTDKMRFGDLSITFRVDEDLVNYREIFKWIRAIGTPSDFAPLTDFMRERETIPRLKSSFDVFSDGTLITLKNTSVANIKIRFHRLFPISLSPINFDLSSTSHPLATITFKMDSYEFAE